MIKVVKIVMVLDFLEEEKKEKYGGNVGFVVLCFQN